MQLGFVIDHSRCIGCHACTVACKSENDVPLGDFRTWVKYTETGEFPQVKRNFAVLRCNQCTDAPCVEICPVIALSKGSNGIVDIDPKLCIGCKSCMQACPYDAIYLNDSKGTVEKCHFCAHRVEVGLAPACAIVCPTEAIIPGDFDDPGSLVSRLLAGDRLRARKVEAGTGPNVWYREADPAGLDPMITNSSGGYLWSQRRETPELEAEILDALEKKARSRTVYDVDQRPMWGWKVGAYIFTKSVSSGAFLVGSFFLPPFAGATSFAVRLAIPLVSMLFLLITTGFLVGDLKRPERFLKVVFHPNRRSWLARGGYVLSGFGPLLAIWAGLAFFPEAPAGATLPLWLLTFAWSAVLSTYTAWLLGQAKGRVLWLRRGLTADILVHAVVAGFGLALAAAPWVHDLESSSGFLRAGLVGSLLVHAALTLTEDRRSPAGREREYRRAVRFLGHGPCARRHWGIGLGAGVVAPLALALVPGVPGLWALGGLLALAAIYSEEDLLIRAGQALPIS